jgi:hypothetical protein
MEKNRFIEGDRVFDIRYGWGHVADYITGNRVKVYFDSDKNAFWFDDVSSRILSFTEYALDGYTAFRPEELPKVGQVVWGRNEFPSEWNIGHYFDKRGSKYLISSNPKTTGWHNSYTEITTENPYENEK